MNELEKSRLIDRKRLMSEYGFTGATADKIMRGCATFQFPGERKIYVERTDVEKLLDEHKLGPVSVRKTA